MSFFGYKVGTIAVTNGSTAVVGTSTIWGSGAVTDGDQLFVLGAGTDWRPYEIQVNSDTSITLDRVYAGSNGSGLAYVIWRTSVQRDSYSSVSKQVADFVATYRALIDVTGGHRYFTLDKTLAADNAGLWFKQGGTSLIRAGLFGDNDFGIEYLVSSTWTRAIKVAAADGAVSISKITTLGIRDTSAAFDVTLAATSSTVLTAGRTLTIDVVNGARTVKLGGNLTLAAGLTTTGAGTPTFAFSGTGRTFTFPDVTDTLAALGAAQTFTGPQTFSVGGTFAANLSMNNCRIIVYSTGAGAGYQYTSWFLRTNGTYTSQTAILNGDNIGAFGWGGHDGIANNIIGASIGGVVNGTVATNSVPVDLVFNTGVISGGTEAMRIKSNNYVGIGISAPTALLHLGASTTARASFCMPHGTAPTSPFDGDVWTTSAGIFVRINGVTKTVTLT